MKSLSSRHKTKVIYVELPDNGPWWDGAMVTHPLVQFYNEQVTPDTEKPKASETFSCVISNSHDSNSCMGVVVEQIEHPDVSASLRLTTSRARNSISWHVVTSHIHRSHLEFSSSTIAPPTAAKIGHIPTIFKVSQPGDNSVKPGHT